MLHVDEPLLRQARLNCHLGAFAVADFVVVVFNLFHQAGCGEVVGYFLAYVKSVHAGVCAAVFVECAVFVEYVDRLQIVGLAEHVVVFVVGGSHFQAASAEIYLHIAVFDHGDLAAH
ncbi:hypothetical protein IMSAGC006_01118 [Muribaculaceae bacterium]|nr:hypothetical protein IMSAGC006_01118 [Muribaculaceae bacterium]